MFAAPYSGSTTEQFQALGQYYTLSMLTNGSTTAKETGRQAKQVFCFSMEFLPGHVKRLP